MKPKESHAHDRNDETLTSPGSFMTRLALIAALSGVAGCAGRTPQAKEPSSFQLSAWIDNSVAIDEAVSVDLQSRHGAVMVGLKIDLD